MKKTLWISGLFMFVFLVFSINTTQAQTLISENDAMMNNAKDRYEQYFNTSVSESDFEATLVPNQSNLNLWNEVLSSFTKEEIRATYGGGSNTQTTTPQLDPNSTVEYDPSSSPQRSYLIVLDGRPTAYSAVRGIVLNIKRNL